MKNIVNMLSFSLKQSVLALLGNFNMIILMSTYPQWLLKTQERIFIGFVADIHKLNISHQFNDSNFNNINYTNFHVLPVSYSNKTASLGTISWHWM